MATGGERQPGRHWASRRVCVPAGVRARGAAHRGSRRRPRGALECARRAIQRRRPARQRPTAPRRCGSCAAAHGHDDDGRLPGGRLTRALPPRANGHDRGARCERRNRAASARWAPRSPGQPASRLHPRALVRAAFDNIGSDRRGLRARHADTHAHSNTRGARRLKVRRSPSIGRARQITCSDHLASRSPRRDHPGCLNSPFGSSVPAPWSGTSLLAVAVSFCLHPMVRFFGVTQFSLRPWLSPSLAIACAGLRAPCVGCRDRSGCSRVTRELVSTEPENPTRRK